MWPALIAQYGIPVAFQIWQTFQKETVTDADWQALIALVNKTKEQELAESKARLITSGQLPPAAASTTPTP